MANAFHYQNTFEDALSDKFRQILSIENYIDVLILIGQSNAVGVAPISGAPSEYQAGISGARIWNGSIFAPLVAGSNNEGADANSFGPELSFAKRYRELSGRPEIRLIKYAASGKSLAVDFLATSGPNYTAMIAEIDAAISYLVTNNINFRLVGACWVQGENDAATASPTYSPAYQTNLTNFIAALRTRYNSRAKNGILDFCIAQLGYINKDTWYYQDTVRQAQVDVAKAASRVTIARADDFTFIGDDVHYNAAGQIALGNRMAESLVTRSSYKEPRPPAWGNLTAWLDPSHPYALGLTGSDINHILGRQSQPLNVGQTGASAKPKVSVETLNNRRIIAFDGNDQLTEPNRNPNTLFASNAGTIIIIQRYDVNRKTCSLNIGTTSATPKWYSPPEVLDHHFFDFGSAVGGRVFGPSPIDFLGNWKVNEFIRRTNGTQEIQVNRQTIASGSVTATIPNAPTNMLRIGSNNTDFLNGLLAEVLIWNKALSDDERIELYSEYIPAKWDLTM